MDGPMRAEGFEVIDDEGRVRARVGRLHTDHMGSVYGLGVYDTQGRVRAWLGTGPGGPHLAFDHEGDLGVLLGVSDAMDPEDDTGPVFVMTGDDGTPVRFWPEAEDDGDEEAER